MCRRKSFARERVGKVEQLGTTKNGNGTKRGEKPSTSPEHNLAAVDSAFRGGEVEERERSLVAVAEEEHRSQARLGNWNEQRGSLEAS